MIKPSCHRPSFSYASITACLVFLAILTTSCSYTQKNTLVGEAELKITPVFKPRVLKANLQVSDLSVTTNSNGTAILWSKLGLELGFPNDIGVEGVDNGGMLSYRRVITSLENNKEAEPILAETADNRPRPIATNVIDDETALIILSRIIPSRASPKRPERRELTLRLLRGGEFIGEPVVIKDRDVPEDDRVHFVDEEEGRFSLFWENATSVRHQTFQIKRGSISKVGPAVTMSKRPGLSAVDQNGHLYFVKVKTGKNGGINVIKTDRDGKILFDDVLIGNRLKVDGAYLPPKNEPDITAGPSSFAVTWTAASEASPTTARSYLQQVSSTGELLGEAVELKAGDEGGMRIATTHGAAIIDDIYASTRRLKPSLGMTNISRKDLLVLQKRKKLLFKDIAADQNQEILKTAAAFMDPASKAALGSTTSYGFMDSRGNTIDADMTRISENTLVITLGDTDPMILVDLYRKGQLLKTIDLGRGEDVALAAHNHDLIATWTGGDGWVDLTVARWRLNGR